MTPIATTQPLSRRERLKLGSTRLQHEVHPFKVLREPKLDMAKPGGTGFTAGLDGSVTSTPCTRKL